MIIQVDSREKPRAIKRILEEFDRQGVQYFVSKLPQADYMSLDNPRLLIDRKQNLLELCQNVCQQLDRFTAELKRAQKYGQHIVILCEHGDNVKSLSDVMHWENPRLSESPLAVSGERLFNILSVISKTYNVDFEFCDKSETGKRIIEILKGGG
ncbi:MAG: ERCC4 domain-containing protein [Firmicutes bacterium]|nr:ERCC4 domain-containing protein [Bacillota bacterium]